MVLDKAADVNTCVKEHILNTNPGQTADTYHESVKGQWVKKDTLPDFVLAGVRSTHL